MITSPGLLSSGSGTVSTRTSPCPCQQSAFMADATSNCHARTSPCAIHTAALRTRQLVERPHSHGHTARLRGTLRIASVPLDPLAVCLPAVVGHARSPATRIGIRAGPEIGRAGVARGLAAERKCHSRGRAPQTTPRSPLINADIARSWRAELLAWFSLRANLSWRWSRDHQRPYASRTLLASREKHRFKRNIAS